MTFQVFQLLSFDATIEGTDDNYHIFICDMGVASNAILHYYAEMGISYISI